MQLDLRSFSAGLLAILLALPAAAPVRAQSFAPEQRGEIERIVKEYLLSHPELMQDVMAELEKRQATADAEKHRAAVKEYSAAIFASPRQVTLGNAQGDVTVVEFFDYNCGYCKRAMADMLDLMKGDSKLRIVLKEFPVLGEGSTQAAQVAVAVRMQDKTGGKKYLEFHQKLLGGRGSADKARALAVAKEIGLNMAQLEKDPATNKYGLRQWEFTDGTYSHYFPLDDAVKPAEIGAHGTKVILVGRKTSDDTMVPPPDTASPSRWISKYLNTRYFQFPFGRRP
jgi:protein-disulfide isomerase